MLLCHVTSLHLRTLYMPYVAFKELLKEIYNEQKNITLRELNPGLLRGSLTTLPLDYQGDILIF